DRGIVNGAPEVAAMGHVAVLALDALAREPAGLPFRVCVLEQLAVEREAVGRELVAAPAELGGEERRGARHAVVRERLARRGAGERAVAARRTEPLVAAHVTAGAHEPSGPERPVVDGVRAGARAFGRAPRARRSAPPGSEAAWRRG